MSTSPFKWKNAPSVISKDPAFTANWQAEGRTPKESMRITGLSKKSDQNASEYAAQKKSRAPGHFR